MQTTYTVFEPAADGAMRPVTEISGSLRQKGTAWEMVTPDRVIPGTLVGHPLSGHVFTDTAGRQYRVL